MTPNGELRLGEQSLEFGVDSEDRATTDVDARVHEGALSPTKPETHTHIRLKIEEKNLKLFDYFVIIYTVLDDFLNSRLVTLSIVRTRLLRNMRVVS